MVSADQGTCNNRMSAKYWLSDSANVPANTWYHFATVLSGTSGTIYVNGTQTASGAFEPPSSDVKTDCRIGADSRSLPNVTIDELKWYNRALSAAEILTDFNTNGPIV
jgi:hypothetical protein